MINVRRLLKPKAEEAITYAWKAKERFSKPGKHVFIASMPKTASTFMVNALAHLLGYRHVWLAYAYERNDQNLYLPKLIDSYSYDTVTHQHLRATDPNIELLHRFSIRPIVLVRNIFDVVVSIRDHMFKEGYAFPTFYCDEHFAKLDETTQLDQIVEMAVPWYFNFYVGWHQAATTAKLDVLWLSYEDVISNWPQALVKIADFHGVGKTEQEAREAVDTTMQQKQSVTRLNKGVVGRGQAKLTDEQKQRIVLMARFYQWVDFSRIGI